MATQKSWRGLGSKAKAVAVARAKMRTLIGRKFIAVVDWWVKASIGVRCLAWTHESWSLFIDKSSVDLVYVSMISNPDRYQVSRVLVNFLLHIWSVPQLLSWNTHYFDLSSFSIFWYGNGLLRRHAFTSSNFCFTVSSAQCRFTFRES